MKQKIDFDNWNRKEHFEFFNQFEEPFWGVCIDIECSLAYQNSKKLGKSFFLYYLHKILKACNEVEQFKLRVIDGEIWRFDTINVSATINRPDGTFGFSYMDFYANFDKFEENALLEIERVRQSKGHPIPQTGVNVIHFSALPWLPFTSLSHARAFSFKDYVPKISVGKIKENEGKKWMPISIHANHALIDGVHIGEFVEVLQQKMNEI